MVYVVFACVMNEKLYEWICVKKRYEWYKMVCLKWVLVNDNCDLLSVSEYDDSVWKVWVWMSSMCWIECVNGLLKGMM